MPTWLTFVRSEKVDPLGLLPSTLSLHDHLLWGFSSHLLLLGRIPINKWSLRPNIKVQAFTPSVPVWVNILSGVNFIVLFIWLYCALLLVVISIIIIIIIIIIIKRIRWNWRIHIYTVLLFIFIILTCMSFWISHWIWTYFLTDS